MSGFYRERFMRDGMRGLGICVEALEGRRLMTVGFVEVGRVVGMETTLGRITVELTPDATPMTVHNFLTNYVGRTLYDNTLVHRSVPGFVIQGGGYQATGSFAHIAQAAPVANEFAGAQAAAAGGKVNVRGTIAMAKLGNDPNSATSEWFINLADNASNLDNQNGGFTVFGRVIGGGMHTVDAIAGLETLDASRLNGAFRELPVVFTAQGPAPVVVKLARVVDALAVRLDGKTKTVTWETAQGATATIALSGGGTADLKFVGLGLRVREVGNSVTVTGPGGVALVDVSAHGTNANSVLAVTSRGGKETAYVGNITTDGAMKRIDAGTAVLQGDVNAVGSVGRIDFARTNGSTIAVGGSGGMVLNVKTAVDTSVKTTMSLKEMKVGKWVEDGLLPTSVTAAGIGRMTVTGNFSSNVISSAGVGTVVINGNVGTLGASVWNITGKVGEVRARALKNLTVQASAVNTVTVSGGIESSTIAAADSIGSVSAASMKGSMVRAGGIGLAGGFLNAGAAVGKVTLNGKGTTFSGSKIWGPTIGTLSLGKVATSNAGQQFGVRTTQGVARLDAVMEGKAVSLREAKSETDVTSYFALKKIKAGDFDVAFVG